MNRITVETRRMADDWELDRFSGLSRLPEMLTIARPLDEGPPGTDPQGAEKLKSYLMDTHSQLHSAMESLAVLQEIADPVTWRECPQEFEGLAGLWVLLSGLSRATSDAIAALDIKAREGRE